MWCSMQRARMHNLCEGPGVLCSLRYIGRFAPPKRLISTLGPEFFLFVCTHRAPMRARSKYCSRASSGFCSKASLNEKCPDFWYAAHLLFPPPSSLPLLSTIAMNTCTVHNQHQRQHHGHHHDFRHQSSRS